MIAGWLAYRTLLSVIDQYSADGYNFSSKFANVGADVVLIRSDEIVLLQIKTRTSDNRTDNQYSIDNSSLHTEDLPPEARWDILWLPTARLESIEDVKKRIEEARVIASTNPTAAFISGFAAAEAAALRISSAVQMPPSDMFATGQLLSTLREYSLVSEQDFKQIMLASRARNCLVHGRPLEAPVSTRDVELVIRLAHRLNDMILSQAVDQLDFVLNTTDVTVNIDRNSIEQRLRDSSMSLREEIIDRMMEIISRVQNPAGNERSDFNS